MFRHGCLLVACLAVFTTQAIADVARVRSRVFELDYHINAAAQPLESVQLWYTTDDGITWHLYGYDDDRQSPVSFSAPSEGKFGFCVLAVNAAGPSSQQPARGTKPQAWVFVDYTPPVVQLHSIQPTTILGQRVIQLRWSAVDAQLPPRPVAVEFQRMPSETWQLATAEPLANTGRFDWRVPDDLSGTLGVRIVVTDNGGHRVESARHVLELTQPSPAETTPAAPMGGARPAINNVGPQRPILVGRSVHGVADAMPTNAPKRRASELFDEALSLRDAGDARRAIARLREVAKLDPKMTSAFSEMGSMLYRLGDYVNALDAFDVAIKQKPGMKASLKGAAMALKQLNKYESSAEKLRTILRYHPSDAQTWLDLGDMGIFQGDELLARDCYIRAGEVDPQATETKEQARKRLALMAEVSRSYGRSAP